MLTLPVREGKVPLADVAAAGDNLLLQPRALGTASFMFRCVPLPTRCDTTPATTRPAPVQLRAYFDHLQLRLFLTPLNRSQLGQKTQYTYFAGGKTANLAIA